MSSEEWKLAAVQVRAGAMEKCEMRVLAHLIGALPTYSRVWKDGSSESTAFWSLFLIASILSVAVSLGEPVQNMLFPIYFVLFDGSMTVLSLRRKKV